MTSHKPLCAARPPNPVLQPTIPGAAQGVLRPPCLLSGLAAEYHVGQVHENRHLCTASTSWKDEKSAMKTTSACELALPLLRTVVGPVMALLSTACGPASIDTDSDSSGTGGAGASGSSTTSNDMNCEYPFEDCDGETSNGCETNLQGTNNCGQCGHNCLGGQCVDMVCAPFTLLTASDISKCAQSETTIYYRAASTIHSITKNGLYGGPLKESEPIWNLTIDDSSIYWTRDYDVYGGPLSGDSFQVLASGSDIATYSATDGSFIYWVTLPINIYRLSTSDPDASPELLHASADDASGSAPGGLFVDGSSIYWIEFAAGGANLYRMSKDHPGEPAVLLVTDGPYGTCKTQDDEFVYYSVADNAIARTNKVTGETGIVVTDTACEEMTAGFGRIYWSDKMNPPGFRVLSALSDGTDIQVLASGEGAALCVLVDSDRIYWSEYDQVGDDYLRSLPR